MRTGCQPPRRLLAGRGYATRMSTFSEWLVATAADKEKTRTDLYRAVGVSSASVSRWFSGEDLPGPLNCAKLAIALGVPAEEGLWRAGYLPRPRLAPPAPEEPIKLLERALTLLRRAGGAPPSGVERRPEPSVETIDDPGSKFLPDSNDPSVTDGEGGGRMGGIAGLPPIEYPVYEVVAATLMALMHGGDAPMPIRTLAIPGDALRDLRNPVFGLRFTDRTFPGYPPETVLNVERTDYCEPGDEIIARRADEFFHGIVATVGDGLTLLPSDGSAAMPLGAETRVAFRIFASTTLKGEPHRRGRLRDRPTNVDHPA